MAIDVAGSTWMVIVLDVLEQVPALVMFHCNTFVPNVKPVTVLVGLLVFVIVAPPLTTDHVPVPVVGVLAAKVVEFVVIQIVWLGPALAILVAGSTCMVIVELVLEQVPAEVMLHCNTFMPNDKPLTVVLGEVDDVNTAEPDTTDQVPVPVVGVLAASIVEFVVIQRV